MIYDVRDMVIAQELEGPAEVAVQQLIFSNKGIFLAASWAGQDTCRIYSLHKHFNYAEIKQENVPINTLSFDYYGMYLAIGTTQNMTISSYKNWKKKQDEAKEQPRPQKQQATHKRGKSETKRNKNALNRTTVQPKMKLQVSDSLLLTRA